MAYLLDTNVVSELRKPVPDPHVTRWHESQLGAEVYLSTLVVGEIRHGIERVRRRDPRQADHLERWLSRLLSAYADHILPVTTEIAQEWGRLNGLDQPPPVVDGLLAATARVHRLTLVTRNVRDVAVADVAVLNPFAPGSPLHRE